MNFVEILKEGIVKVLNSEKDFAALQLEALQEVISKHNLQGLGDRKTYVGASDLSGCVRRAALNKRDKKNIDLTAALHFIRGHLDEVVVIMALRAMDVRFTYQPELIHPDKPYIKAHLDFLFEDANRVHILDCKSGKIKANADMWHEQMQTQMGLARLNFPDKKVTGSVLNLDLTGAQIRYFDLELYTSEFEKCIVKADLLWDVLNAPGTEDAHARVDYLCGWCNHIETCPRFSGKGLTEIPNLIETVEEFVNAKAISDSATAETDSLKEDLLEIAKGLGRKVKVGGHTMRAAKRTRKGGIDEKKLEEEKPDVAADLNENYRKPASEYYLLEVKEIRVKETKKKAAKN